MVWKKKERELTLDEAIEIAKKELYPFWYNSSPLIAGIHYQKKFSVHPLTPDFSKTNWFIYFIDPTQISSTDLLEVVREWDRRYRNYNLKTVIMLNSPYELFDQPPVVKKFLETHHLKFALGVDKGNTVLSSFHFKVLPKFLFIQQGELAINLDGSDWMNQAESEIQAAFRRTDPGLPLETCKVFDSLKFSDSFQVEFNKKSPNSLFFLKDPMTPEELQDKLPQYEEKNAGSRPILFSGKWKYEDEGISTEDSKASVAFRMENEDFSVIARTLTKTAEHGKISISANRAPIYETFFGDHLKIDENGFTSIEVRDPRLYHIARDFPASENQIFALRFPSAHRVPLSLVGFRFR